MKSTACLMVICLAACTTVSPVTSLGGGKFMVAYQRRGGLDSWTDVKAGAIGEANRYCSAQGQKAEVLDAEEQGARGWTPMNVELTFRCAS